jgi:hypothetical protein
MEERKMKKILTALVVVALIIATIVLVSCSQEHVHDFTKTVVKPTCSLEGYTEYVCNSCDYSYRDSIVAADGQTHTYGSAYTYKEATCTATGVSRRECQECGYVKDTSIKKTNHTYLAETEEILVEATCTEKGKKQNACSVCGNVKTEDIKALGHDWTDWVTDKAASCATEEHGHEYRDCLRCELHEEREVLPHTATDKGQVTKPTCVTVGYTTYTCADCGVEYVRDYKKPTGKHNFTSWEPVEGSENLNKRVCKDCGYFEVK